MDIRLPFATQPAEGSEPSRRSDVHSRSSYFSGEQPSIVHYCLFQFARADGNLLNFITVCKNARNKLFFCLPVFLDDDAYIAAGIERILLFFYFFQACQFTQTRYVLVFSLREACLQPVDVLVEQFS